MIIKVLGLNERADVAQSVAQFGRPLDRNTEIGILKSGLSHGSTYAGGCMGWIWYQWLLGSAGNEITQQVEAFVQRGLEYRNRSRSYYKLPLHDLFLLNCAILASRHDQLLQVAEIIGDGSGDKGERPQDNGELFVALWTGAMKYWILGDTEKATLQFTQIWSTRREQGVTMAPKNLAQAWLKRDWTKFVNAQGKDFERLWTRARKDETIVGPESDRETTVTLNQYYVETDWCWHHCGLALLAHRQGIKIATDPLWFPSHALEVVPKP
jgi:hypothetical protein